MDEETGREIARKLGIHYDGVWPDTNYFAFTDLRVTRTSIAGRNLEETQAKLEAARKLYANHHKQE